MVKLYKNFNINNHHKNSILLIGNFDGLHLGHQKLFKLALSYKKKFNAKIITPSQSERRGCQLSVLINHNANLLFNDISNLGVKIDYREPNVIRIAPVPLYNSFYDIYLFGEKLKLCLWIKKI